MCVRVCVCVCVCVCVLEDATLHASKIDHNICSHHEHKRNSMGIIYLLYTYAHSVGTYVPELKGWPDAHHSMDRLSAVYPAPPTAQCPVPQPAQDIESSGTQTTQYTLHTYCTQIKNTSFKNKEKLKDDIYTFNKSIIII